MQLADLRHRIDDRTALVRALQEVLGPDRAFTHPGDLIAYEYDGSVLTAIPDLVVHPVSTEEVVGVVTAAGRHRVPLIPRGSGTGLSGGAITPIGGIIVSLARMNRILHVDLDNRCAVVQPGVINLDITKAVAAGGYFYAPYPSSQSACSMLGIFESIEEASQAVTDIIASGIGPTSLEMIDELTVEAVEPGLHAGLPLDAGAILLIEVEGVTEVLDRSVRTVDALCRKNRAREVRLARTEEERHLYWAARKGAFGAMGRLAPNYFLHDAVVPRSQLPAILRQVVAIARRYGIRVANVFHAGDGNLHPLIPYDASNAEETGRVLKASEEMLAACIAAGGTLSGSTGSGSRRTTTCRGSFPPPTSTPSTGSRPRSTRTSS